MLPGTTQNNWFEPNGGTLTIGGPITVVQAGHLFLQDGNFVLNSPGSITISTSNAAYALVMNAVVGSTTNFLQTGSVISVSRSNNNAVYLTQGGTTNYTITGGSLLLSGGSSALCIGDGTNKGSALNINGAGALVATPKLNVNAATGTCTGAVNMQSGLFQTDQMFQSSACTIPFNFSGGTIQPLDGTLALTWGLSTTANIAMTLSGSEVMSSNDASGVGRTVTVFTPMSGNGILTTAGTGTLQLTTNQQCGADLAARPDRRRGHSRYEQFQYTDAHRAKHIERAGI